MDPVVFATIQFHKCNFVNCVLPQGISIVENSGDIKADYGIKEEAAKISAQATAIYKDTAKSEVEKGAALKALISEEMRDRVTDKRRAALDISSSRFVPSSRVSPISSQCVIDPAMKSGGKGSH